jgi:hypothetical protein
MTSHASHQVISTRMHGIEDYMLVVILLAAPYILGFADRTAAQYVPMIIGLVIFGTSLFTRYELGAFRIIPMPMHLTLDAGAAVILAASPWIFGFANRVYLPHLVLGVVELVVVMLSQTHPEDARLNA